jgi:Domain of unknown function (DUF222)/HNH endonuclease
VCTSQLPASAGEALAAVRAGLAYLNGMDTADLPGPVQAGCLRELARAESAQTAAHARVLSAFRASSAYEDDGQGSARMWLRWQTQITKGAADGAIGWMRRLAAHPDLAAALAEGSISPSYARVIAAWTGQLPEAHQAGADEILLAAAAGGASLADLAGLAGEMRARTATADEGGPEAGRDEDGFASRRLRLSLTFRGAGHLDGELTPACAAALGAVLESLGKKAGPEDVRTPVQRDHDALEEACRRLAGAGCLPDRAGQPTQVQLHLTLDQLRNQPGGCAAESAWRAGQATGDGQPGWLSGRAAAGYACDSAITPLVTGHLDPAALDTVAAAFLARHPCPLHGRGQPARGPGQPGPGHRDAGHGEHGGGLAGAHAGPGDGPGPGGCRCTAPPLPLATAARLRATLLRYAADLLSGPAGLAAFLRTRLLGGEFPAVSLPLDVGAATPAVPGHLRRAVITRDRHCAFPGCTQPPPACQVHHLQPRASGGPTRLDNLILLCAFHHLIAVHQWGWDVTLHPDGTVTARSPDGQRILHSHGPPPRPPEPSRPRAGAAALPAGSISREGGFP